MLNVQLPQFISPRKMARQGQKIQGIIPVSVMKRVEDLLVDQCGEMQVSLTFRVDDEGLSIIQGTIEGLVTMRCERCMDVMAIKVTTHVSLACVYTDEQAVSLPERYEPLLTLSEQTDLYALVEEELLLSLPIVAYHPDDTCRLHQKSFGESEMPETESMANKIEVANKVEIAVSEASAEGNPFAVLAQLKSQT